MPTQHALHLNLCIDAVPEQADNAQDMNILRKKLMPYRLTSTVIAHDGWQGHRTAGQAR
jgi:hypothetical protein